MIYSNRIIIPEIGKGVLSTACARKSMIPCKETLVVTEMANITDSCDGVLFVMCFWNLRDHKNNYFRALRSKLHCPPEKYSIAHKAQHNHGMFWHWHCDFVEL